MSGLLYTSVLCFGVAYILLTLRKWIMATRWSEAVKVLVLGLAMNVLVLAAMVGSIPFLDPLIQDLMLKEVPNGQRE